MKIGTIVERINCDGPTVRIGDIVYISRVYGEHVEINGNNNYVYLLSDFKLLERYMGESSGH